jgi:hypothetical protein
VKLGHPGTYSLLHLLRPALSACRLAFACG